MEIDHYTRLIKIKITIMIMKMITVAFARDLLKQVDKGEISFSRMVEIINEEALTKNEFKLYSESLTFNEVGNIENIKTATLFLKPTSKFIPNYYIEETDKWVVFPWERKEFSN